MKKIPAAFTFLRKHGFTLIELLVVIAIIAILAAVLAGVSVNVINTAKKTKAQNTASQIQTAALSYYAEYSVYPTPTGAASGGDTELTDNDTGSYWGPMIECLSGGISPSAGGTVTLTTFSNSRLVPFITLKASDVGTGTPYVKDAPLNPLPYSTAHPYFNMALDTSYDGIIGTGDTGSPSSSTWLPSFTGTTTFNFLGSGGSSTAGVAVWANCSPTGSTTQASWCVHTY